MTDTELTELEAAARAATPMYISSINVSFNEWYRWMIGYSYSKGYENFDALFSKKRVKKEAKGFVKKWGENIYKKYFNDYILYKILLDTNAPICSQECSYRKMPESLPPQQNALRIEWAGSDIPRCGARPKYDPFCRYPQFEYCTYKDKEANND